MKKYRCVIGFILLLSCNIMSCSKNVNDPSTDYELEIENNSRIFKSEVSPKTSAEELVLDRFKVSITDDFDELNKIYYNQMQSDIDLLKDGVKKGLYTKSIVVHSLKEIDESDYSSDWSNVLYYPKMYKLKAYNPYLFEMIEVKYTQVLSEASKGVQYGDGDYLRCFVVTKENKDSEWKIFDGFGAY